MLKLIYQFSLNRVNRFRKIEEVLFSIKKRAHLINFKVSLPWFLSKCKILSDKNLTY